MATFGSETELISPTKTTSETSTMQQQLKCAVVVGYDQAPSFMKFNPYIRNGYRLFLTPKYCLKSALWWTNETVNIWSHLSGSILFCLISIYEMYNLNFFSFNHERWGDSFIFMAVLFSFQGCLLVSALYHTFNCQSEQSQKMWLFWDLTGISCCLACIFTSGLHYAFSCFTGWRTFYISSVILWLVLSLVANKIRVNDLCRQLIYFGWAAYGLVPTTHWVILHNGFGNPLVQVLFPRILVMFVLVLIAFFFFVSKFPERMCPGKVDYVFSSHNLWHIMVVVSFLWWYFTGLAWLEHTNNHTCHSMINYGVNVAPSIILDLNQEPALL